MRERARERIRENQEWIDALQNEREELDYHFYSEWETSSRNTFSQFLLLLLSDHILSQYKELMLGFLSTSWWTQDWWHVPDIDLCTEKTINKHINWLIQSYPPCLHQAFWLACCEKLKLFFNLIIPYKINHTAFDGFSTLITGLVNTRIRVKVSDGSTFVTEMKIDWRPWLWIYL